MRTTTKLLSVIILILLASPVVFLKGCGKTLNGDACGGCPNTTAPNGSAVKAPLDSAESLPAPGAGCVNSLVFTFVGPDSLPLNGICVEVFTNSGVALSVKPGDCTNPALQYAQYLRTRTDKGGTVTVDFATPLLAAASTNNFFVQVSSCSTGATWKGTWTVQ